VHHKDLLEKLVIEEQATSFDMAAMQGRVSPRQPMDIDFNSKMDSESEHSHKSAPSHTWNQWRALMKKNFALQAKQKGTNICQILTPIVCLIFIILIKTIAEGRLSPAFTFSLPIPFIYNVPYGFLYGTIPQLLNFTGALYFET